MRQQPVVDQVGTGVVGPGNTANSGYRVGQLSVTRTFLRAEPLRSYVCNGTRHILVITGVIHNQ